MLGFSWSQLGMWVSACIASILRCMFWLHELNSVSFLIPHCLLTQKMPFFWNIIKTLVLLCSTYMEYGIASQTNLCMNNVKMFPWKGFQSSGRTSLFLPGTLKIFLVVYLLCLLQRLPQDFFLFPCFSCPKHKIDMQSAGNYSICKRKHVKGLTKSCRLFLSQFRKKG